MRVNSLLTRTMRSSVVRIATASGACSNSSSPISALPGIRGDRARGSTGSSGWAGDSGVLDCDGFIGCPPIVIAAVKLRDRTEDTISFNRSRCIDLLGATSVCYRKLDSFPIAAVIHYKNRPADLAVVRKETTCLPERNGYLLPVSWIGTTPMCEKTKSSQR